MTSRITAAITTTAGMMIQNDFLYLAFTFLCSFPKNIYRANGYTFAFCRYNHEYDHGCNYTYCIIAYGFIFFHCHFPSPVCKIDNPFIFSFLRTALSEMLRRCGMDIICQCEYGQSRRAGCAAAILKHYEHKGIDIFRAYKYYPNQLIFNKIYEALNQLK